MGCLVRSSGQGLDPWSKGPRFYMVPSSKGMRALEAVFKRLFKKKLEDNCKGLWVNCKDLSMKQRAWDWELQALRAQAATPRDLEHPQVHAFASPPPIPQPLRKQPPLALQDRRIPELPAVQPQVYGGYLHEVRASAPLASLQDVAMAGMQPRTDDGQTALQAPTTSVHGQTALQAPTTSSHGQTALQAPTTSSHGQTALQASSTGSYGQTAPQASTAGMQALARTPMQQSSRGVDGYPSQVDRVNGEGPQREVPVQVQRQRSRSPDGNAGGPSIAAPSDL